MKKRTLLEEIKRIQEITYGTQIIKEDDFGSGWLGDVVSRLNGSMESLSKKLDVPDKADFVNNDVKDFYNTLDKIDMPVFQQSHGSMVYQKEVETIQIGLLLLGYKLPRHGVDGLFGPETAAAVNDFNRDNPITTDSQFPLNESPLESPLPSIKVNQAFGVANGHESSHPGVDLAASSGTQVKSPADGKIIKTATDSPKCGGTVTIQHGGGFTSRYCHLKNINTQVGQDVKQGDVIGISGGDASDYGKGNSTGAHLHFELKKDGSLVDPLDYIDKGNINLSTPSKNGSKATFTPEMADIMVTRLKEKNIKSEDLKKYLDPVTSGGSASFTDLNLSDDNDYKKYGKICQDFIDKRNSSAQVKGAMLANAAKSAFISYHKYVPPELALAQLALEGGLVSDVNARPIKTNNPFNVGNTVTASKYYSTIQDGVNAYYNLIARRYLGRGKTATDLIHAFVDRDNQNYSGKDDGKYEAQLGQIAREANKIAQQNAI
jgi:peptidoglycan hydrolase-like protein with peptidoglycan-binding domain